MAQAADVWFSYRITAQWEGVVKANWKHCQQQKEWCMLQVCRAPMGWMLDNPKCQRRQSGSTHSVGEEREGKSATKGWPVHIITVENPSEMKQQTSCHNLWWKEAQKLPEWAVPILTLSQSPTGPNGIHWSSRRVYCIIVGSYQKLGKVTYLLVLLTYWLTYL